MIDNNDAMQKSIEEAFSVQEKIKDAIIPTLETQEELSAISAKLTRSLTALNEDLFFPHSMLEALKQSIRNSALDIINFQISAPALDALSQTKDSLTASISDSFKKMLDNYPSFVDGLRTPALDWFCSFDFSPITERINNLLINTKPSFQCKKINEIYLRVMYDSKWFPYAWWIADISLLQEVNEIIFTSRGASKSREKRIDKAILSYYTDTVICNIKKSWWKSALDYCIRKSLRQSIEAYLRGEYALTISCLSTMWEGLIYIKAKDTDTSERKRQPMKDTKGEMKELVEYNDYELIFSNYFNDFIVSECNEVKDVIEGVPNRHGVAHSWYRKYPNKKAALNAILLTDFIINLKPIEQAEEKDNG